MLQLKRPTICTAIHTEQWGDGRLIREISKFWTEYDVKIVNGSTESPGFPDDIYLIRNPFQLSPVPVPNHSRRKIICMLESERPLLIPGCVVRYPYTGLVVSQNKFIRDRARSMGIPNVSDLIIANGVNLEEFRPAYWFPDEFTVGAVGNFSSREFDEWKGFGRYIVPACKMANVKLRWCSYGDRAFSLPGLVGKQIPIHEMGEWYRGLNCIVSMSRSEGCSCITFEAMATGLPVISTKVGWHGENCSDELIWIDRPKIPTPEDDEAAIRSLAGKIMALRDDRAACRSIGEKARAFAEKWPHSRIADQWRPIFESTLHSTRGG